MLGIFQLAFSHFAFAVDSNPGTPSSEINVDLVNGIAVRILDEAGQQQIDNINLDLTAIPGGSFVSGKFNVEVSTSNKTGYKLYMDSSYDQSSVMGTTSPDYTTNLVNQTNTSYVIPTLTNNITLAEFQSGSNNSSNKWGYSLDDATFSPIPVQSTPDEIDSLSTPTASTLTPVTIGTNVNMDMASGVYKNQLTFTAVAEPIPIGYTLAYDANGGTGAPASQSSTTSSGSATFTISSTKPTRKNFIFAGWADSASATTATYQPGDSITVTPEGWDDTTKTLYAVWQATPFWTITNMQEMTPEICDSLYTPSNATGSAVTLVSDASAYSVVTGDNQPYVAQRTLYDIRDNNSYTIRKLADGNCWMTENLRLEFDGNTTYDSTTTNLAAGATITPTATQARSAAATAEEIAEWKNSDYEHPTDADLNRWLSRGSQGRRESDNSSGDLTGENQLLGTYYNWYTATAGYGLHATVMTSVPYSICPKGWRLPNSLEARLDWTNLIINVYGIIQEPGSQSTDTANRILNGLPFTIPYNGRILASNGDLRNQGQFANFWSGKAVEVHSAYNYSANSYNNIYGVSPDSAAVKGRGNGIRCIAI